MTIRRPLTLALLVGVAFSCSEATSPSRVPTYEWRLFVAQNDSVTDTLSFHWPTDRLPVKIWVEDSLDMPARVQEGVDMWRGVFLYGEYDAVLVSDSSTADVIVRVELAPPKAPAGVGRLNTMFPGCEGATDFDVDTAAAPFLLQLPVRMYLTPRYNPATADLTECFRVVARHELGHSIGIFQHTSDPQDIMYGDPVAEGLSTRDSNTVQALSHYPANVIPTR